MAILRIDESRIKSMAVDIAREIRKPKKTNEYYYPQGYDGDERLRIIGFGLSPGVSEAIFDEDEMNVYDYITIHEINLTAQLAAPGSDTLSARLRLPSKILSSIGGSSFAANPLDIFYMRITDDNAKYRVNYRNMKGGGFRINKASKGLDLLVSSGTTFIAGQVFWSPGQL